MPADGLLDGTDQGSTISRFERPAQPGDHARHDVRHGDATMAADDPFERPVSRNLRAQPIARRELVRREVEPPVAQEMTQPVVVHTRAA